MGWLAAGFSALIYPPRFGGRQGLLGDGEVCGSAVGTPPPSSRIESAGMMAAVLGHTVMQRPESKGKPNPKALDSFGLGLHLANFSRGVAKSDEAPLGRLEPPLVDLQRLDLGLQRRRRDAEPNRRPEGSRHASFALEQGRFDDVPFLARERGGRL